MERKHTLVYGIKGKLISAVCMLLVAMIMVVSSTYAWFTLSTAPEVSGISTAIGSNGALEIKLNNTLDPNDENASYGNLVDLSGTAYGLDQIVLYPSYLNATDGAIGSSYLLVPGYGANGKPNTDTSKNAGVGLLNSTVNKFVESTADEYGVRAVGLTSGMTVRQQAYRDARLTASAAIDTVIREARTSLNTNADPLAKIVIKKASNDNATYTQADIAPFATIIDDLEDIVGELDVAYEAQLKALAASKLSDTLAGGNVEIGSKIYQAVVDYIDDDNFKLSTFTDSADTITVTVDNTGYTIDLSEHAANIKSGILALNAMRTRVSTASNKYGLLVDAQSNTMTWADIADVVNALINPTYVKVNGLDANGIDTGALANAVLRDGGLIITMSSAADGQNNAGVYVDIADHCGDYQVAVTVHNIAYGATSLDEAKATMVADGYASPAYLNQSSNKIAEYGQSIGAGNEVLPMNQFCGYILDFIFRTNAADSDLLLQVDGIDRIYSDGSSQNTETMGGGSYMSYSSTDLSINQITSLMGAIRIVFFDTETKDIYGYARLDMENYTQDALGVVKAYLYMCDDEGVATVDKTENGKTIKGNTIKQNLPQNGEVQVSTLVYLTGDPNDNGVDNTMVSATSAKSLIGSMNIQFSSSANLVPMDYADLKKPSDNYKVEFKVGGTTLATTTAPKDTEYTFTIPEAITNVYEIESVTYSVGGTGIGTLTPDGEGKYTIPASNVTGNIAINITGTAKTAESTGE